VTALDIGRISEEAKQLQFGRGLLTIIAAILYAIGWTARKVFVVAWLVISWSYAAVRLGWREAAPKPHPKR
jgi:hypothetical protein